MNEYQRGYENGRNGEYCPCGMSLAYCRGWAQGMNDRRAWFADAVAKREAKS